MKKYKVFVAQPDSMNQGYGSEPFYEADEIWGINSVHSMFIDLSNIENTENGPKKTMFMYINKQFVTRIEVSE